VHKLREKTERAELQNSAGFGLRIYTEVTLNHRLPEQNTKLTHF